MKNIDFNKIFEEFHWEEEEKPVKIGEWVGRPRMDWDLNVYCPCIVMEYLSNNEVLLGEALSFKYGDNRNYHKTKIKYLEILDKKMQEAYNKKLLTSRYSEGWINFLNNNK